MSEIKSHEFENFLQRAPRTGGIFLIYGPDRGLVSERAGQLARLTGVALDDVFATLRLTASDLVGNPGRLLDEMNAIGLFGGDRLIWVKEAGNDKPLIEAIDILDKQPPQGCSLIIEAERVGAVDDPHRVEVGGRRRRHRAPSSAATFALRCAGFAHPEPAGAGGLARECARIPGLFAVALLDLDGVAAVSGRGAGLVGRTQKSIAAVDGA